MLPDNSLHKRQSGIALVILVIIIALAMTTYYFNSISVVDIRVGNKEQTREVLKQAKQALIDYAVMHGDIDSPIVNGGAGEYGYLPCPFINETAFGVEEGEQQNQCGARHLNSIGLFPWRDLETDVLRDSSGNCLWYAVSGSYKNSVFSRLLNQDSNGMLQVVDAANNVQVGNAIEDRVVAIILAPGAAIEGQNRVIDSDLHCGTEGTAALIGQYLDSNGVTDNATLNGVAHEPDAFIHADMTTTNAPVGISYNDQFITVSREDIWNAVFQRNGLDTNFLELTEALAQCLAEYAQTNAGRRLPFPAPLAADDYRDTADYDDRSVADVAVDGYAGRFPYSVDDSNAEIGVGGSEFIEAAGLCDNLALPVTGGPNVDLTNNNQLYRKLYDNWKDHFFYALSEAYKPEAGAYTGCGNCITVGGVPRAGVVFFAGRPEGGQTRSYDDLNLPAGDRKDEVGNYLENDNELDFPDLTGTAAFDVSVTGDIMFCLTDANPPAVVAC